MDRNDVLVAIERAIAAGVSPIDETSDPEKGHTFGAHVRSLATVFAPSYDIIRDVMHVLEQQPDLKWLMRSFYLPGPGGGGVGILPEKVTHWLLAKSLSLPGGPSEAISALEDFSQRNATWGHRVVVVYGAYVEESIDLTGEICLLPISELQPSLGLDGLAEALGEIVYQLPMVKHDDLVLVPAICALVQRFEMSPALRVETGDGWPEWHVQHPKEFEFLERLAEALALFPDAMPQCVSKWVETEGIDAIPGLTGGLSGDFELMEVIPRRHVRLQPLDKDTVTDQLRKFMQLSRDVKQKLSTPLRRLAIANTRRNVDDRAVDLGIALEAMFGGRANSEITHKVAVRGSVFTSRKSDERLRNYKILKTAYNLRSKIVHGGQVQADQMIKSVCLPASEVVERSAVLLQLALNKVVDAGSFPNWTEVDLAIQ